MAKSTLWSQELVAEVQHKAKTGKYKLRGFGTNRPYPNLDDLIIIPAQLTGTPAVDKYRENINTRVVIGQHLARPLVLETPLFVPAMSFGAVGKKAKMAFATGAALMGTATNTGEGGGLPEERACCQGRGGKLVVQWSTGRFGVNVDYLRTADAIEVKIGQGAKPGMGGHLLAEKINDDIAAIRGIPHGTDALSPCRHLDAAGVNDLKKQVEMLREVTGREIPIIIKLGPADVYEDVKTAVELGADAVAIDGGEGGTGCAPEIVIEHAGVPTLGLFAPAVKALEDSGGRERGVKLLVMGGIRHGADVYKALALGADAVGMATAAMVAIGCIGCQQCHGGVCPVGIATQKDEALDWQEAGQKLGNFLAATTEELKILTALSGHNDIAQLSKDDLAAVTYDGAAVTGTKLMGYDRSLPMWEEAGQTDSRGKTFDLRQNAG